MLYLFIKTIHLTSAILFIGTLFFWTFVIDRSFRSADIEKPCLDKAETLLSIYTRKIMRINVAVLVLSGLGLLHFHSAVFTSFSFASVLLGTKIFVALILAVMFYMMPRIHAALPVQKRAKMHDILHHAMFGGAIVVILCAKFYLM